MPVRPIAWGDFEGFVNAYYTRYAEVDSNPDLGVYLFPEKPSLGEEAAFFAQLQRAILEGDAVCFVAEEEGRVLGAATVQRKGKHREDRHVGELGIALEPASRGRGLGHQLLTATVEACHGKFEILLLSVLENNGAAKHLYQKHGFAEYGRAPRTFKRGDRYLDDVLMWRAV